MSETEFMELFSGRLRRGLEYNQRNHHPMTQHQLAQESGIHYSTISRYARKKRQPSAMHVRMIAKALGVSADWMLGMRETEGELT